MIAMNFTAWTFEAIRERIVEAALTLRASPAALGPRMKSGSMRDIVEEWAAYGAEEEKPRRLPPTAQALSRMEETWGWINSFLAEAQRKFVYDYGFIKTRRGRTINAYIKRLGISRSTFDRQIREYCQIIADSLNQKCLVRLTVPMDGLTKNHLESGSLTVSSDNRDHGPRHWIATGAKPQIDPALPPERVIEPRAIRARHSDKNRRSGAKAIL